MFKRSVLPAIMLLLALWLLAACATATTAPVATDTPVPTDTPAPTATSMSAEAIVEAALEATQAAESFHVDMSMVMTMSMPAALPAPVRIPVTMVGDVQPPDRSHATVSMNMQGLNIETEMVTISNTTYVKNPSTGEWLVSTQSASPLSPDDLLSFKPGEMEGLTIVGEETLDGVPVYHLAGTASMPLEIGEPFGTATGMVEVDYWIDKEDNYVRQGTIFGDIPVTGEMTATISISATMILSDYGKTVTIEAPEVGATPAP